MNCLHQISVLILCFHLSLVTPDSEQGFSWDGRDDLIEKVKNWNNHSDPKELGIDQAYYYVKNGLNRPVWNRAQHSECKGVSTIRDILF